MSTTSFLRADPGSAVLPGVPGNKTRSWAIWEQMAGLSQRPNIPSSLLAATGPRLGRRSRCARLGDPPRAGRGAKHLACGGQAGEPGATPSEIRSVKRTRMKSMDMKRLLEAKTATLLGRVSIYSDRLGRIWALSGLVIGIPTMMVASFIFGCDVKELIRILDVFTIPMACIYVVNLVAKRLQK